MDRTGGNSFLSPCILLLQPLISPVYLSLTLTFLINILDERALVIAARAMGYVFCEREPDCVIIRVVSFFSTKSYSSPYARIQHFAEPVEAQWWNRVWHALHLPALNKLLLGTASPLGMAGHCLNQFLRLALFGLRSSFSADQFATRVRSQADSLLEPTLENHLIEGWYCRHA